MNTRASDYSPLAGALILLSAGVAVFLTGKEEVWASVVFLTGAGVAMLVSRPVFRPGWLPLTLGLLFCLTGLLAFLPQAWFPEPAWRALFPAGGPVPLGDSVSPQPWLGWYWWLLLVASFVVGAFLLSTPSQGRGLAVFLHIVALVVALYTVLAIVVWQTGWNPPFRQGDVFGFLPNRNHTATLLFVGAIISFGVMQWETTHGHRGGAVLAALCGAPPLAGLLFFSNSRAGVVFLAVGIVIWAVGAARGAARRKVLGAAAILVVFLAVLFSLGGSEVRNRLVALWDSATETAGDSGDQYVDFRQPIFRDSLSLLRDVPVTGVGLGQFSYVFPQYRQESARAAVVFHPESSWLMAACEMGLLSVLIWAAAVVWFFVRCWKARDADDGMLRWTAASAVGAALAHGFVDVPWHRVALGWFLFAVAIAVVPSSGIPFRRPLLARMVAAVAGLAILGGGLHLAWERMHGRFPPPLQWESYTRQLTELSRENKGEEGEFAAAEAIRVFPLKHEPYYWLVGYLRMFLGTDGEIDQATRAGRLVEPILPRVAVDQAILWKGLDPAREAEAWSEAVRRATRLDVVEGRGDLSGAGGQVQSAMASLKERPDGQAAFLRLLAGNSLVAAYAVRFASPEVAAEWLDGLADAPAFLDSLPDALRQKVLDRWVALPDASAAVAYMEAKSSPAPGPFWRQLARHHANAGDKPRAVSVVAQAWGVPQEGGGRSLNEFGKEIAALEAQGNEVAVRRLLREALDAKRADADRLAVAMAAYAAAGDWDSAWKAASRLATEAKLPQ